MIPAPSNLGQQSDLGLVDYFQALFETPKAQITLETGDTLTLQPAGLGRAYQLDHLAQLVNDSPLEDRVGIFRQWLQAGGVPDPDQIPLGDLVEVSTAVKGLNLPAGRLAWDLIPADPDPDPAGGPRPTDYTGRALARVVHTLAEHYGWPIEQIINLPRAVALAHLQECILADRRRKEWEYSLSEVAWQYDAGAKVSRFQPLPPLPWEVAPKAQAREEETVPDWVREKYYPKGVIIDLQDLERRKRNRGGERPGQGESGGHQPG